MMPDRQKRQQLIDHIVRKMDHVSDQDDKVRAIITRTVAEEYAGSNLTLAQRQAIIAQLFNTMRGLDLLQPLMDDSTITEIMVNGPEHIFVEKEGKIETVPLHFDGTEHLVNMISRFFGRANKPINEQNPIADMRLPDGSRVHAVMPPAAPNGPVLSIRRFNGIKPDLAELVKMDSLTQEAVEYLSRAVSSKRNIFISGGTSTGKTTFLNALSGCIDPAERVITIEDAAELDLQGINNLVRLEARAAGVDGQGAISLSDLIRSSLRMRPDRIIVGEVRGVEAYDMLQAMQTGHPGSMSTGHGNSCEDMLDRLGLMMLMASHLPWEASCRLVASALDLIIQLQRHGSGRRLVTDICKVTPGQSGIFHIHHIFTRDPGGPLIACPEQLQP